MLQGKLQIFACQPLTPRGIVAEASGDRTPRTSILITIRRGASAKVSRASERWKVEAISRETSGKQFSYQPVISGRLSHGL